MHHLTSTRIIWRPCGHHELVVIRSGQSRDASPRLRGQNEGRSTDTVATILFPRLAVLENLCTVDHFKFWAGCRTMSEIGWAILCLCAMFRASCSTIATGSPTRSNLAQAQGASYSMQLIIAHVSPLESRNNESAFALMPHFGQIDALWTCHTARAARSSLTLGYGLCSLLFVHLVQ
jgi:hypothetical protein